MPKWEPWEGAFRAAGEGADGARPGWVHHGSCVWTLEAAQDRRKSLGAMVPRTWVETYSRDGGWKRLGDVIRTEEPPPPTT